MKLGLKITLAMAVFLIGMWGVDQAAWMFNHPWFIGEDAAAIILALLITLLTITAIRIILFTKRYPPYKPIPVNLEAETEQEQKEPQQEQEQEVTIEESRD